MAALWFVAAPGLYWRLRVVCRTVRGAYRRRDTSSAGRIGGVPPHGKTMKRTRGEACGGKRFMVSGADLPLWVTDVRAAPGKRIE
tara:strand:- start:1168 stop:1422 length:255 start_codon:yes stop_codon:yes gene_type:complete